MLVLLAVSTVAAALVPPPRNDDDTSSTSSTSPRTSELPPGGQLASATIDADSKRPEHIVVPLGDQLSLTVRSGRTAQVEIRRLGLLEDVAPLSPARFDILATEPGRHEVRMLQPGRKLGVIEIRDDDG